MWSAAPTLRQPAAGTGTRLCAARACSKAKAAAAACRYRASSLRRRDPEVRSSVEIVDADVAVDEGVVGQHGGQ